MAGDIEQEDVFYECRDWAADLTRREKEIAAKNERISKLESSLEESRKTVKRLKYEVEDSNRKYSELRDADYRLRRRLEV